MLIACALLGLVSAVATGVLITPALLDVNRIARENREIVKRVQENSRQLSENAARDAERDQRLALEARERRDQMCDLFERQHLADVKRLRRTYAYLKRLPRSEWGTNFTVEVVRGMPALELEARQDRAPRFCDELGIGLGEPDPVLPRRRDFSRLLRP